MADDSCDRRPDHFLSLLFLYRKKFLWQFISIHHRSGDHLVRYVFSRLL